MKLAAQFLFVMSVLFSRSAASETSEDLTSQVRLAEITFAQTMAERDLDSFVSHISDEAIFFGSKNVLRGIEAIKAGWSPFFEGPDPPFSWEPEIVEVLDSGILAFSSGPVTDAEGQQIGTFNSIWQRDAKGQWKVIFDKGCPPCGSVEPPENQN